MVQYGLADGVDPAGRQAALLGCSAGRGGNLTLTPATPNVTAGAPTTITATWSGLTPGAVYLGILQFGQGSNLTNSTFVTVRT